MVRTILGIILAGVLGGVTLFSGSAGIMKAAQSFNSPRVVAPEVAQSEVIPEPTPTPTPTVHPPRARVVADTLVTPTPTPTPTPTSGGPTGCFITLFGKQYDVTKLETTHSGGNIFKCGMDMTAVYQAQHGTDMTRMQPYLVTPTSTVQAPTPTPGSGTVRVDDSLETEDHSERQKSLERSLHNEGD